MEIWYFLILAVGVSSLYLIGVRIFWKNRLRKFRKDIIEKSDDDITKTYFFWERFLILVGSVLVIAIIFSVCYKLFHFIPSKSTAENVIQVVMTHFDVTGIIVGIVGIIVGFFIYVVVENNNETKSFEVREQLDILKEANSKIRDSVIEIKNVSTDIAGRLANLNEQTSLEKRLEGVKTVIEHATENDNNLYILTYNPIYGQFFISNLKVLLNENNVSSRSINRIRHQEFFEKFMDRFQRQLNINQLALLNFATIKPTMLHIAVLKNAWPNSSGPTRFKQFVEEHIIRDNRIVFIDKDSKDKVVEQSIFGDTEAEKTYVHAHSSDIFGQEDKKKIMIEELMSRDQNCISNLLNTGVKPEYLDYIPFQFFLSIPKSSNPKRKFSALVIFTNYYDISQEHGVVSFSSDNEHLCVGLKSMYKGLVKTQQNKDSIQKPVKQLFTVKEGPTIKIVLKSVTVERQKQFQKYRTVTPVADSVAKDKIFVLLQNNDVNYISDVKFLHEEELNSFLKSEQENDYSFFSVGLFFNPLSNFVALSSNLKDGNTKGFLYRLIYPPSPQNDGEVPVKKKIEVAVAGNKNDPDNIETIPFLESFNCDDIGEEEKCDYAIFSKQKIGNRWVFVFGGINYFASLHIHECINDKHCFFIFSQAKEGEFIAVFKVKDADDIDMQLLSIVDENGTIKNIKRPQSPTTVPQFNSLANTEIQNTFN